LAEKLPSVIMTGVESRYFLRINGHPLTNTGLSSPTLNFAGLYAFFDAFH
jgi:hypothetical protein